MKINLEGVGVRRGVQRRLESLFDEGARYSLCLTAACAKGVEMGCYVDKHNLI